MPEAFLGVKVGYWLLFGIITLFHAAMEMTPYIANKSKKRFMDWRYYYREFSAKQNEEGSKALLLWFLLHQRLIPRRSKMMYPFMLNCNFVLPEYNRQFEVETAYGTIFFAILSADELNIHGFRAAVRRRNWFFGPAKQENLDRLITFLKEDVYDPCCIYYAEKAIRPTVRNPDKYYDEEVPPEMEKLLKRVFAKFQQEEMARQADIPEAEVVKEEDVTFETDPEAFPTASSIPRRNISRYPMYVQLSM